jgi:dynein intermediate chain 2
LFDARTKTSTAPTEISPIERSHRDPVYDVVWVASKAGTDFFSASTDGQVLWWDYRRMGEPVEKMMLEVKGEGGGVLGGTALDYDSAMVRP